MPRTLEGTSARWVPGDDFPLQAAAAVYVPGFGGCVCRRPMAGGDRCDVLKPVFSVDTRRAAVNLSILMAGRRSACPLSASNALGLLIDSFFMAVLLYFCFILPNLVISYFSYLSFLNCFSAAKLGNFKTTTLTSNSNLTG